MFVFAFKNLEAEFADDGVALFFVDVALFVFGTDALEPGVGVHVRIISDGGPPFFYKIGADRVGTDSGV
jgi:hypothetical protein